MKLQWEASGGHGFALAFGLVCLMGVASARAQNADSPQDKPSATRLLTVEEGRSIADAALEQQQPARGTQDCSHLIHEIYGSADCRQKGKLTPAGCCRNIAISLTMLLRV